MHATQNQIANLCAQSSLPAFSSVATGMKTQKVRRLMDQARSWLAVGMVAAAVLDAGHSEALGQGTLVHNGYSTAADWNGNTCFLSFVSPGGGSIQGIEIQNSDSRPAYLSRIQFIAGGVDNGNQPANFAYAVVNVGVAADTASSLNGTVAFNLVRGAQGYQAAPQFTVQAGTSLTYLQSSSPGNELTVDIPVGKLPLAQGTNVVLFGIYGQAPYLNQSFTVESKTSGPASWSYNSAGGSLALNLSTRSQFDGVLAARVWLDYDTVTLTNTVRDGGSFRFSFASRLGRTYTVQYEEALGADGWNTLTSLTGTGNLLTVADTIGTNRTRFYRVQWN